LASIQLHEYETYILLILSGQIPQEDVPRLLADNPDFARWYRERQGLHHGDVLWINTAA
jgi:hypothetical protein